MRVSEVQNSDFCMTYFVCHNDKYIVSIEQWVNYYIKKKINQIFHLEKNQNHFL